jgi:O-6-methylguanine DNA methyltransferase
MKTSDLDLIFDDKLSRSYWANIKMVEGDADVLWFGTVPLSIGKMTVIGCDDKLCYLGFDEKKSIQKCQKFFPKASFEVDSKKAQKMADLVMDVWNGRTDKKLFVMVQGTEFQKQVWNSLLKIPSGHVVSYGTIADEIGKPKAVRAVGTAVGANPVSLIIPCHRVVQKSGKVENYGWGDAMKQGLLKVESLN